MSFEDREESAEGGQPIELYTFTLYGTQYRFTNSPNDELVGLQTYLSETIEHSEIFDSNDLERQNVTLTVALDFPMLSYYETVPPSDVILITIQSIHRGDTEVVTFWNGRVTNALRKDNGAELTCENIRSSMRQAGLRRRFGKMCGHELYSQNMYDCQANPLLHRVLATVDGVSGLQIQSTAFAALVDGRLAGGFIEAEISPGIVEKRSIKSHVGNTIEITHVVPGLTALSQLYAYKGCKYTLPDCINEFGNQANYGGFPYMKSLNPMAGDSVF